MRECRVLDIDNVARIGLMFIDGDKLEDVLLDKLGHTDYDFENFNILKKVLMKIEKINPDLDLTAVLWQNRPDNENLVVPVVAGNALPVEGWGRKNVNPSMKAVFEAGTSQVLKHDGEIASYYYAVKNSNAEIVGVLELLSGLRTPNDI
jgi:hypothetical protein